MPGPAGPSTFVTVSPYASYQYDYIGWLRETVDQEEADAGLQ